MVFKIFDNSVNYSTLVNCIRCRFSIHMGGRRLKTLIYIIKVALILILLSIPTIILSCVWEV